MMGMCRACASARSVVTNTFSVSSAHPIQPAGCSGMQRKLVWGCWEGGDTWSRWDSFVSGSELESVTVGHVSPSQIGYTDPETDSLGPGVPQERAREGGQGEGGEGRGASGAIYGARPCLPLSLIHISEPTRPRLI
eukprot:276810-Rhodomonas_salina.1